MLAANIIDWTTASGAGEYVTSFQQHSMQTATICHLKLEMGSPGAHSPIHLEGSRDLGLMLEKDWMLWAHAEGRLLWA